MEREQIKPQDFVVMSLCLYGFPLYSFFTFSSIAGTMSRKSRQHCCVECLKD